MKVSIYNKTLLLLLLVVGTAFSNTNATTPFVKKEFTKKIERIYDIAADGNVDLNNRYGQVTVKTWDKNKVEVEVVIKVNSRSEESAEETFDRINIEMSNSANNVSVATNIESNSNNSWTSWFGGSSNDDFSIHYLIHMPATNDLTLANKYGNSAVEDIKGDADLTIKYGNIDMGNVGGDLNFDLGYGNATIGNSGDASVVIKYSNFKMNDAKEVIIESKYSKVKIQSATDIRSTSKYDSYKLGKIKSLRNEGKYDHFNIEGVEELEINTKYTDVDIDDLYHSADVEMSHGGLSVKTLSPKFSSLRLEGKYTDFKIGCSGDFYLDASTSYGDIHYPAGMEVLIDKEKSSEHEVEGYRGNKNSGKIKARLGYGSLKIY